MRGVVAKRRVAFFGRSYGQGATSTLPIPEFLFPLRARLADWLKVEPAEFAMALINEYTIGTPVGWHRDAPQYAIVAGVSLLSACRMKFRPYVGPERAQAAATGGDARHHARAALGLSHDGRFTNALRAPRPARRCLALLDHLQDVAEIKPEVARGLLSTGMRSQISHVEYHMDRYWRNHRYRDGTSYTHEVPAAQGHPRGGQRSVGRAASI